MRISSKNITELTEPERDRWRSLCTRPEFSSPFLHPEYVERLSPSRPQVEVAIFEQNDRFGFFPFERHPGGIGRPLGVKLADFQGIVCDGEIFFSESEFLKGVGLRCLHFDHLLPMTPRPTGVVRADASPYLALEQGVEHYLKDRRAQGNRSLSQLPRKQRKLEREVGAVEFRWHDDDPIALERLFEWKSAQRERTETVNILDYPWVRGFLNELSQHQGPGVSGVLSTLRVNDQVVAAHLGIRTSTCLHYWFPAYDNEVSRYSPGQILLYQMAVKCEEQGIGRIDLGKGDDSYKDSFASGATEVWTGTAELSTARRLMRTSMHSMKSWLKQSRFRSALQLPKRMLRQWQSNSTMGAS